MKRSLRIAPMLLAVVLSACSLNGWVTYNDATYPYQIDYPAKGSLVSSEPGYVRIALPFQSGSTLVDSFLEIFVNPEADPCLNPYSEKYGSPVGKMVTGAGLFAGTHWVEERGSGTHVPFMVDWLSYSSPFGWNCVSITLRLEYNPDLILPPYDLSVEELQFRDIMRSFQWHYPTQPGFDLPTLPAPPSPPMIEVLPSRTPTTTLADLPVLPEPPTPTTQPASTPTPTATNRWNSPTPTATGPRRWLSPTPTSTGRNP
jgi:hypothetical protein